MHGYQILVCSDYGFALVQTGQHELPGFTGPAHGFDGHIDIVSRDQLFPIGNCPSSGGNILCSHPGAPAYGGNFETLSAANQLAALTDLANNKPTSFNGLVPSDFFNEVFFMTWCGFLMDPLWGGNQGMVGWELTGFNGVNMGNFYGEGMTTKQLMVSTTPTRLKPASLAQFQAASGAGT